MTDVGLQTNDYHHREPGLGMRENGLSLRENGLGLTRDNGLNLREDDLRDNGGGTEMDESLKLRLTNGHTNYDIAKITAHRHPGLNGFKEEYMGPEEIRGYDSNPPSPYLEAKIEADSDRKVNFHLILLYFFDHFNCVL